MDRRLFSTESTSPPPTNDDDTTPRDSENEMTPNSNTDDENVKSFLKESYRKSGQINTEKRQRVLEFFSHIENQSKGGGGKRKSSQPSWNQLAVFSHEVKLNVRQIYGIMEEESKQQKLHQYIQQTRGRITKRKKQLIQQWLKQTNYKRPDSNERLYLSAAAGISPTQLHDLLRRLMDPPGKITDSKRELIRQCYENNNYRRPSRDEMKELKEKTGLSSFQLQNIFRYMILNRKTGHITHEKKQLFPQILKDHNNTIPSNETVREIAKRMRLSTTQVYNQLYLLKNSNPQRVNEEHKQMVENYMREHGNPRLWDDPEKHHTELTRLTGLTRIQIVQLLRRLSDVLGEVTEETKDILRAWLKENNHRRPNDEERAMLLKATGWSLSQLSSQLMRIGEEQGEITSDSEQVIRDWIEMHQRKPKGAEVKQLSEKTGLARVQLYYLVNKILDPPGELTAETKEMVFEWMKQNKERMQKSLRLSKQEKAQLLQETGWSHEQLRTQMRLFKPKL